MAVCFFLRVSEGTIVNHRPLRWNEILGNTFLCICPNLPSQTERFWNWRHISLLAGKTCFHLKDKFLLPFAQFNKIVYSFIDIQRLSAANQSKISASWPPLRPSQFNTGAPKRGGFYHWSQNTRRNHSLQPGWGSLTLTGNINAQKSLNLSYFFLRTCWKAHCF